MSKPTYCILFMGFSFGFDSEPDLWSGLCISTPGKPPRDLYIQTRGHPAASALLSATADVRGIVRLTTIYRNRDRKGVGCALVVCYPLATALRWARSSPVTGELHRPGAPGLRVDWFGSGPG